MPRKKLGEEQPGSWDYGVDYEKAYRKLVKLLQRGQGLNQVLHSNSVNNIEKRV